VSRVPLSSPAAMRRTLRTGLALAVLLAGCGRREKSQPAASPAPARGAAPAAADALFLAEAPVMVPEELGPELSAIKVGRIYAAAASLDASGKVTSFPPPPSRLPLPVVFTVMSSGAESALKGKADALGETWASGIAQAVSDAKRWADVAGVHLHLWPTPEMAETLAGALSVVRKRVGLPISVTVPAEAPPEAWKPLKGAADELLVLAFGRRPETLDRMARELTEEQARKFPVPFRLLLVLGGYGFPGDKPIGAPDAHRIPDAQVDKLSENAALDFELHFLSTEPGDVFSFRPKLESSPSKNPLAVLGGAATFQVPTLPELTQLLSAAERWKQVPLLGRVFLLDGVPEDGHILGYRAVKAILTGEPTEPSLSIDVSPGGAGQGWAEFSLIAANRSAAPSDLSRVNNWVQVRVEGGVIAAVRAGDFDRYTLHAADPTSTRHYGDAGICRLLENLFVPGEVNVAGPIKVTGTNPRLFVSYQLSVPGHDAVKGAEVEKVLPTVRGRAPEPTKPSKRR